MGRIVGGYIAAVLVSASMIGAGYGLLAVALQKYGVGNPVLAFLSLTVLATMFAAPVTAVLTVLPAIAVIYWAEYRRVRSLTVYAGAAALIAVVALVGFVELIGWNNGMGHPFDPYIVFDPSSLFALIIALPGVGAGATYWAVAGRYAGCDR